MRIGYDGRFLTQDLIEGQVVYSKQLLGQLLSLYSSHKYFFFFNSLTQDFENIEFLKRKEDLRKVIMRIPTFPHDGLNLKLFFDISLPFHLKKNKIDVFHGLQNFVPPGGKTKIVTTFHDLLALVHPEFNPPKVNKVWWLWYAKAVKRSAQIIAVSYSTRNDLLKFFDLPSEKIVVIHEAPAPTFRPIEEERIKNSIQCKYHLPSRFILASGGLHARKNLKRAINSFSELKKRTSDEYKLVLFSGSSHLSEIWAPLIHQLKLEGQVVFLYSVPEEDLPVIYSLADLFIYPSLYEGFGIPILEAMSCGTPVITSNLSSMPEVAGDAALLVDPTNTEDLTKAMYQVLNNDTLRNKLTRDGLERVKYFSWEKTSQQTMEVYQRVYNI